MTSSGGINYGRIMERAMRSVMSDVLGLVAEDGLPGEHHFYITFDTTHPGVDMPDTLREAYPAEMMIVLQEWFEGLAVMGDRFTVTLNFSNVPQTLVVPFAAVKTFIDPSVKFGLKFDDMDEDAPAPVVEAVPSDGETTADAGAQGRAADGDADRGADGRADGSADGRTGDGAEDSAAGGDPKPGDDGDESGQRGQVVSLDSFRKT
ncbi:MAG: ClpXP protease specificity-enhancing factor SspB [Pseudomonadota bacterium]